MNVGTLMSILALVCIVLGILALRSFFDIMRSGSGLGCIFRDKSQEAAIILSAISCVAIFVCYLAITDILKDYAGYMLTLPDGQSVQSVLPNWAKCEGEWGWVLRGGLVLFFSQLAMLAIMVRSTRNQRQTIYPVGSERGYNRAGKAEA